MKKILLPFIVLVFTAFAAKAQDDERTPRIAGGFTVGAAVGPHSTDYPVAIGLEGKFELPISESPISLLVSTGYTFYVSKDGYAVGYNSYDGDYTYGSVVSFVPVQVGARVYAGKLYFEGNVGASFNLNSANAYTQSKVALMVSPNIGYGFRFGNEGKFGLDLALGYENRFEKKSYTVDNYYGSFGQIAVRVAFSLGL